MNNRFIYSILIILLSVLTLSSCNRNLQNTSTSAINSSTSLPQSSLPQSSSSLSETSDTITTNIALCMMSSKYTSYQLVQLGFLEKAAEMREYNAELCVSGELPVQDMLEYFDHYIKENEIEGFIYWGSGATDFDFIKDQYNNGVKTVIPYFDLKMAISESEYMYVGGNPISNEYARHIQAADILVEQLKTRGINSGSIVYYAPYTDYGFADRIQAISNYKVIPIYLEFNREKDIEKIKNMTINNEDIIAVCDAVYTSYWNDLYGQYKNHAELVYISMYNFPEVLTALKNGQISAIITEPYYEAGEFGMEMLDRVLKGETFEGDAWQPALPTYIVTADGTGKNGPDFYLDQYARAEALFGPANQ